MAIARGLWYTARNAIELGIVERTGACDPMGSIYLRDADENLIEISVYQT